MGFSGGQIATKISRGRGAVGSKVSRLGLQLRGGAVRAANRGDDKQGIAASGKHRERHSGTQSTGAIYRPATQKNSTSDGPVGKGRPLDRARLRAAFDPEMAPKESIGVHLMQLEADMCKWPMFTDGARIFCGAATVLKNRGG